jgi:maltose O-acetyltransferase
MKTEREKMLAGELYNAGDAELCAARARARRLCRAFNTTPEEDGETRDALLRELLGSAGQDIYVESDFKCDYGCNIHVGENFYANFDVVILRGAHRKELYARPTRMHLHCHAPA